MESYTAVAALSALAHEGRLEIYRRLVAAGPKGLTVGEIAAKVKMPGATLSFHLSQLQHAGLVAARRSGRKLIQTADFERMNGLLGYLTENCCGGDIAACAPLQAKAIPRENEQASAAMNETAQNVLFLCTGNSARSIMAEALLNHWGAGSFKGYSAGSFPKGDVHPLALQTLRRHRIATDAPRSKSWDEFARAGAPPMDFVLTVCDQAAGEVCPIWPGHPITAHWGIPDPAAVEGELETRLAAFDDAFRVLQLRIQFFLTFRFKDLRRADLEKKVAEAGKLIAESNREKPG